jgi:DNA-binding transcriptional LysR family regulator
METREIEAFLAVADELHFGRAARRLLVTTSHVSQTIRKLETRVGGALFDRTSRRVSLTPLGAQFLSQVRPAYESLRRALDDAQNSARADGRERDVLRVGFSTTLLTGLPPRLIDGFQRACPLCRLVRSDHPATEIYRCLDRGDFGIDAFVCWFPDLPYKALPPGISVGPAIRRAARGILMAKTHPLARHSTVDVEELAEHDVLHPTGLGSLGDAWTPPVTPAGRPIRRVVKPGDIFMEAMPDLLACGDLLHLTGIYASELHLPGLVVMPLTGLPPAVCTTVWHTGNDNPWITLFAETAAQLGASPPRGVSRFEAGTGNTKV